MSAGCVVDVFSLLNILMEPFFLCFRDSPPAWHYQTSLEVLDRTIEIGGDILKDGLCTCATTKRAGVRAEFSGLVVEPQSLTQSWDPAG